MHHIQPTKHLSSIFVSALLFVLLLSNHAAPKPLYAAERTTQRASASLGRDSRASLNDLNRQLETLPRWTGWMFLVIGFIPLFWGWRFLRTVVSIFFAILFARIAFTLAVPHLGSLGAMVCSIFASMIGGSVGWHARALLISVEGAIVLGATLFTLGAYLGSTNLALGLGVFGILTGLFLGFKYAPYLEAIEAALIGASLVGMGVTVLQPSADPQQNTYYVIGAALSAAFISIYYQFKHIPEWVESGELKPQQSRRTRR